MEFELHFEYSPRFARRAFLAQLWDSAMVYIVASGLVFIACVRGVQSESFGPLAWFGLGVVTTTWSFYLWALRRSGRAASAIRDPRLTVKLSEDGMVFHGADFQSSVKWESVQAVQRLKSVWVLKRRGYDVMTALPATALTPESREFLVRMVQEAGGHVR